MKVIIKASTNDYWWKKYFTISKEDRPDFPTVDDPYFSSYHLKHVGWLVPKAGYETLWDLGDIEVAAEPSGKLVPVQTMGSRVYDVFEDTVLEAIR